MPGINITVTQLYDKVVIGGLDYSPSADTLSGYECLVAKLADNTGSLAVDKAIKIEPFLEPDQWFIALTNPDEDPQLERKKTPDDDCLRFRNGSGLTGMEKAWQDIAVRGLSGSSLDNNVGDFFLVIFDGKPCWACKGEDNNIHVKYSSSSTLENATVSGKTLLYVGYDLRLSANTPENNDTLITIINQSITY